MRAREGGKVRGERESKGRVRDGGREKRGR